MQRTFLPLVWLPKTCLAVHWYHQALFSLSPLKIVPTPFYIPSPSPHYSPLLSTDSFFFFFLQILMASTIAALLALALAVALTTSSDSNLASPLGVELEISTISAAPAVLPGAPVSSPELSPDITPLLPSPAGGSGVAPAGSIPTIPSNPSPPNPDEVVAPGPTAAAGSPSTEPFNAMAASKSAAVAADGNGVYVGCMVLLSLGLIQVLLI